uniref:Uncharacterized protein n=1 Tax=Tanacetum cinerariifolium TaxID=118510 RepID=A0A6L2NFD4_TANCI|nr:hypothetical protein [Tanacetum cinerariifolium]
MDMKIDQQVALDEALVPHASRLRIGKSNFQLKSDITSKELTLQVVYDVLRLTQFYKVFLLTADVPEIYMQEFWATATIHHHSICFKMNNKKRIVNLEYFREMLHICPRIPNQTFDELLFEEEILAFLRYLRHSGEIKKITDVNINKLYQPWRSFVVVINKCLSGKVQGTTVSGYLKIRFFGDPSIPIRNKVNWHYVRDDQMFTMIKLVLRHQNTQQFGAMLPVELTNEDIKNSAAYKEYYAIASGAAPHKTKASMRKTQSSFDTIMPPLTVAGTRLSTSAKGKQPAKSTKAKGLSVLSEVSLTEAEQIRLATKRSLQQTYISQASGSGADEGTGIIPGVPIVPTDESDEEISWKSSDKDDDDDDDVDDQSDADDDDDKEDEDEQDDDDQDDNDDDQDSNNNDDDFVHLRLSTHDEEAKDEESFDPIVQTPSHVEDSDDESHGINVGGDEGHDAEDDEELYRDVNINLEGRDVQMTDVHITQVLEDTHVTLTPVNPDGIDSLFESTPQVDVPVTTTVVPLLVIAPTLPPPSIPIMTQFVEAVSSILEIVDRYIDQRMNKAVKVAVRLHSDRLRDDAQAENEDFINKLDENIQKIIKEQVREQVKEQVKGSCKSLVELKFFLKEVYKATTDQLDWNNPKGHQYPHNLLKPLPRIPNSQGKLTNLTVEERFPFNVSLRMFMRSIVIQRCTEDLQLGVESYQKKLNLIRSDTYRFDLKHKEAYTAYSNPRGFIYQNKDKQNRLMRIDELHKFSDGTLNDVRSALDDRLKGIRMKYLP